MEQLPFFIGSPWILLILAWTLPWKGVALWKAAKNHHKWWFVALLVMNTMAVLEIIYIFFFSKPRSKISTELRNH